MSPQLFFFACLMGLVMLVFLWMARGYKYASGVADTTKTAAAADSQHAIDDDSTPVSIREVINMRQHE